MYGEGHSDDETLNLRGKIYQMCDGAGVVTTGTYDFKGNPLHGTRQLAREYKRAVDWSSLGDLTDPGAIEAAAMPLLEQDTDEESFTFTTRTAYDALNRPISLVTPDRSETLPTYNEANLLETMRVRLRGAEIATDFVADIDYNARGQRETIQYGNGVCTTYQYDEKTFRLENLRTTRPANHALQDLFYTYDPVGNITHIQDDATPAIFHNGEEVLPHNSYTYDALYRLARATGREHIGQNGRNQPHHLPELKPHYDFNDVTRTGLDHPNDGQAMCNYVQSYDYDPVGNFLAMVHRARGGDWTRHYENAEENNRLLSTSLPGDAEEGPYSGRYGYDVHGNMISMPHLAQMDWDFKDQLQQVDLGGGGTAYYVYDAAGQRVRKVIERQNGNLQKQRIYLGGFEVYREYNGSGADVMLERETLHVMEDQQRIALVETRTQGDDGLPQQLIRYQLGNHLGSASLELDSEAQVISYEEYYPYGSSSYQAVRSQTETPKRYRYTGMERDEETGLNYHTARYYVSWLGRWISTDPIGLRGGTNLYGYPLCNPIRVSDVTGTGPFEELLQQYTFESGIEVEFQGESGETVQLRARLDLSSEDRPEIVLMHEEGETRIPASLENIEGTGLGAFISTEDIPSLQTAAGGTTDVYLGLGQRYALFEALRMAQCAEEIERAIPAGARSGMPIALSNTTDMFENTTMPAALAAQSRR